MLTRLLVQLFLINMAARYKLMRSVSAFPAEGTRGTQIRSVTIQNLLRMDRQRDVPTNGETEKADRKRKLEAITVDDDIRVSLCIFIFSQRSNHT